MKTFPPGVKLTKQGVRDLGGNDRRVDPKWWYPLIYQCQHRRMRECHLRCGHWYCPDCKISFDDWGEGGVIRR
jgi:hypothetical protein